MKKQEMEFEQTERQVQNLLKRSLPRVEEVPPFLKSRVLAHALPQTKTRTFRWVWFSALASAACGLIAIALIPATFKADIERPVAVKFDVKDLAQSSVTHAVIELSNGVSFYSKRFPDLQAQRTMEMAFEAGSAARGFPVVVKGLEAGERVVKVRFLNASNAVIAEKELKITFRAARPLSLNARGIWT